MLKAGIIGFGVMGKKHCQCYQMMRDVKVVSICETNPIKKDNTSHAAANVGKKDLSWISAMLISTKITVKC